MRRLPVIVALAVMAAAPARAQDQPPPSNPVAAENARPGSPRWDLEPSPPRAIEGYASETSVAPGDSFHLHVRAPLADRYRILVYRLGWYGGDGGRLVTCIPGCDSDEPAVPQPAPRPPERGTGRVAAGWQATDALPVGSDWVSGYYLAQLRVTAGPDEGALGRVPLVVRGTPGDHAAILVQVPVNTWQAYNGWGGKSLYPFSSSDGVQAIRVSFDRPFAWTLPGGQGPLGWELPLIRFIERNGYDVTYQSDVFTARHPASLWQHRLVVVAGHDEYWTKSMRDGFDAARAFGINLAFMGANDAYWQIRLQDRGRTILTYKSMDDPNPDPRRKTAMFRELIPPRLECDLIGVQHQGVGLSWAPGDYTVAPTALSSPWMRDTGFSVGDVVRGIVSVESDTIPGNQSAADSCGNRLTVFFHRELGGDKDGNADSTMYTAASGARVFASGSHQFSWGLDDFAADPAEGHGYADERLARFMRNVFDGLSSD
jgi:hypothetical protein